MWKTLAILGVATLATTSAAYGQDATTGNSKTLLVRNNSQSERQAIYDQAAVVAMRAGVSPENGLSPEELLSILLVVSLKQSDKSHAS